MKPIRAAVTVLCLFLIHGASLSADTRGVAILSSQVGKEVSLEEIQAFVDTCNINLVVIDFAWITYHFNATDLKAVARLSEQLQGEGVKVAVMYRPRVLSPNIEKIHYAKNKKGEIAKSHNQLCFAHEDSQEWGAKWGSALLKALPSIDTVILYNLLAQCQCNRCCKGKAVKHSERFLKKCRTDWKAVNKKVRIGHVGAGLQADLLFPFLSVNRKDTDEPVDVSVRVAEIAEMKAKQPVTPLLKICWSSSTNNTTEDLCHAIAKCEENKLGFLLWYYSWIFHSDDGRYDPYEALASLGGERDKMSKYFTISRHKKAKKRSDAWVYFESRESEKGAGPCLNWISGKKSRKLPVTLDTVLLSYLENYVLGAHKQLSLSMNDRNRVLLYFDLTSLEGALLDKAELVLDMKNSARPVKAPFDLNIHLVKESWSEKNTAWKNQPVFGENPVLIQRIEPKSAVIRVDVTDLVKIWRADPGANHGLLLKAGKVFEEEEAKPPELTFPFKQLVIKKLPWPHQPPGLSKKAVKQLNHDVWVINDYPLYQADLEGRRRYFHCGLDIVTENGQEIYAMEDGWVKSIHSSTMAIGEKKGDAPSYGWEYTHLNDFRFKEGDYVKAGACIGKVDFRGLAHIHLTKVFSQGGHWGSWKYACPPYAHFDYKDETPPVIRTPFYFFENHSNKRFKPDLTGKVCVKGDVDLVVAMRDGGHYARSKEIDFGDRLGVARMEYAITPLFGEKGGTQRFPGFDFNRIRIKKGFSGAEYGTNLTRTVYKHWREIQGEPPKGNKNFSFYILTNCPREGCPQTLEIRDQDHFWPTTQFPDGRYRISVTAWDFKGNRADAEMVVFVKNQGS